MSVHGTLTTAAVGFMHCLAIRREHAGVVRVCVCVCVCVCDKSYMALGRGGCSALASVTCFLRHSRPRTLSCVFGLILMVYVYIKQPACRCVCK